MAPSVVHLPNGYNLTVTPVFGGLYFKSAESSSRHPTIFPPGWTIVLHSEDDETNSPPDTDGDAKEDAPKSRRRYTHTYRKPSLNNDHLFISSISYPQTEPASSNFPSSSPTRQIAMMLWATLWWYFHQPVPTPQLHTEASASTPDAGKPRGDWRLWINREGIFKGKQLMQKLERMGMICSTDSSVGTDPDPNTPAGWDHMFISQRHFWQLDARIYLFTLAPQINSPFPSGAATPIMSRPGSPSLNRHSTDSLMINQQQQHPTHGLWQPPGQFKSSSHLPTFYPPAPPQYILNPDGIRHPLRPKPPRQGETFYTRFVPSLGEYLSFRVASLSERPVAHLGPTAKSGPAPTDNMTDVEILHRWMNDARVNYSWGEAGPAAHQEAFLRHNLESRNAFPVIGSFDGKPFGYFELYWVKEDRLGKYLGGNVGDWDRGLHVLVGEQAFRGKHRVMVWLSALVHYLWLADARTESVMLEPRVDNVKLKQYCEEAGFFKEREISFPHKQSNLMRVRRDAWVAPAI